MDTNNFDMLIKNIEGKTIEAIIVARWHDENDYIAYTDGSKTEEELNLLVSRYIIKNNEIILEKILDDLEWQRVNKFLSITFYGGQE